MRIYIWTDIEGVAGMIDWDDYVSDSPLILETRRRMMKILTGEVNAAITASFDAGATQVLVKDSHGPGNSMYFEDLHPDAELIIGTKGLPNPWAGLDSGFDCSIIIGAHPMEGTERGILPHTIYKINDYEVGDAGLFAAVSASLGVPAIFASGDDAAMGQLKNLIPEIHTVSTKWAFSPYSAKTLMPSKVRSLITTGVRDAIKRKDSIRPLAIQKPYHVEFDGVTADGDDLIETFMRLYDPDHTCFGTQEIEPEQAHYAKKLKKWADRFDNTP